MTLSLDNRRTLEALEVRLRVLLPEEYQDSYETCEPKPMGSAGLKYGADGQVAWDEMWGASAIWRWPAGRRTRARCSSRLARGDRRASRSLRRGRRRDLPRHHDGDRSPRASVADPGWVRVTCFSDAMAGVAAARHRDGERVGARAAARPSICRPRPASGSKRRSRTSSPSSPRPATTGSGHMPREQQRAIADLFAAHGGGVATHRSGRRREDGARASAPEGLSRAIERETGWKAAHHQYRGWLGVECSTVKAAIWMMRMMVASNVLSRREGTVLFLPVNDVSDAGGEIVTRLLTRVHRFAAARSIV